MQISSNTIWYKTMKFFNSELFWKYENGYRELNSCKYFWLSIWTTLQALFAIAAIGFLTEVLFSYWVWFIFDFTIVSTGLNELSRYVNLAIVSVTVGLYYRGLYQEWDIERKSSPDYQPKVEKESVFWESVKAYKSKFCFKIEIVD